MVLAVIAAGALALLAPDASAVCKEAKEDGPGMTQGGFFPLEPGGPPIECVVPFAAMAPLYLADAVMATLGIVKGVREGWPGVRWQTGALLLGAGQLLGGTVILYGVATDEIDGAWLGHGVAIAGAGAALVTGAVLAAALAKPPPVKIAPLATRGGGGLMLTLKF